MPLYFKSIVMSSYLEGLPFVCFWNPNLVRVWTWCKHKIEWSSSQTLDPQTHDDTFDEKIRKVVSDIWPFPCHSKVLYIKDVLFNTNLESAKTVCRKVPKLFMTIRWHQGLQFSANSIFLYLPHGLVLTGLPWVICWCMYFNPLVSLYYLRCRLGKGVTTLWELLNTLTWCQTCHISRLFKTISSEWNIYILSFIHDVRL